MSIQACYKTNTPADSVLVLSTNELVDLADILQFASESIERYESLDCAVYRSQILAFKRRVDAARVSGV